MARVLIADDDIRIRRMVETSLRYLGHQVVTAANGAQALEMARRTDPDLIVLDIMMPEIDGLQVCRRLRELPALSHVPILMLTARGTIDDKEVGYSAGTDDYLTKPFELRELELKVEALLRRSQIQKRQQMPNDILQVGGLVLDLHTYQAVVDGRLVQLTPVEFDLLRYLMSKAGEVVSSEKLLQDVWQYYPGTGDPTVVRMQIMNLRNKLEADPQNPIYLKTIYRHGYTIARSEDHGRVTESE